MSISADSYLGRFVSAVARTDPAFQRTGGYPRTVIGRFLFALFNPVSAQRPTGNGHPARSRARTVGVFLLDVAKIILFILISPFLIPIILIAGRGLKC